MGTSEKKEFSLAEEVEKLRKYLWLPITYVEFDPRYEYGKLFTDEDWNIIWIDAKLYVNDDMIGTIPYFSSDHGFGYDTGNHSVLAWDKIYPQFKQVIFDKIFQQEPLTVTAEPAEYEAHAYLTLNVKDKDGTLIKKAGCCFIDGEWEVNVSGLGGVKRTVTVKVTLTLPSSRDAKDAQKYPQ